MKKYTNIDDLFKAGAAGFEMEPSAGLFDEITALYLKEKRRKRMVVYIWSLAALLLLLIGISGSLLLNDKQVNGAVEREQIITENIVHEEVKEEVKTVIWQKPEENLDHQEIIPIGHIFTEKKNLLVDESNEFAKGKIENVFGENETKSNLVIEDETDNSLTDKFSSELPEHITINELPSRCIFEIAQANPSTIDPRTVKGMEKYLEKRNNLHFYTGIGATIAKAFYPDTEDQFTWSADLAVGLRISNFYIESGVGYQQMNERGIYQIDFRSNDSIGYFNEVVSFEIDPQNPDEISYKTKETTVYDSVDHYTHTTPLFEYAYVNVPVKIGYRFLEKDKFSLSAETGIIFSWMVSKQIPDVTLNNPDYELLAITNQTPERDDLNFQWQLSLRLNYHFTKSISLVAQPVFTKYINSIYDTDSGYKSVKPYTMGVRFGIYFDF